MRGQISIWCGCAVAVMALGCGEDGEQDADPPSGGRSSMAGSDAGEGSGSGGDGSNESGRGGVGPTSGRGGSGRGGAGSEAPAGSGQAGGDGGAMSGDAGASGSHCSPGTTYYVGGGDWPPFSFVETFCDERDVNGDGTEDHFNNILLEEPMRPGETYTFSGMWDGGWVEAEFWGSDTSCGEARELLASVRIEEGEIACFTMNPTMAHTQLLWVWAEGGGAQGDFAICPMGSCEP